MLARLMLAALLMASPPVVAEGGRVVDLRDNSGTLTRYMVIPSSSVFRTHGGRTARCSYVSPGPGVTSDGQRVEAGQTVESSRWMFVEGLPVAIGEPTPQDPTVSRGPLVDAVRWFTVFCDSLQHAIGVVSVSSTDPMIDPRRQADSLFHRLELVRPVVFRNPVVDRWGGLITRFQTWLAVRPAAWATQSSPVVEWRGWTMHLQAQPVAMDFRVDFTPSTGAAGSFHGVVPCVARNAPVRAGGGAVPAMPELPAISRPGVNGPCRWTPPGPGTVVLRARLTYRVTFWANGYTEQLKDYVWTSAPAAYSVGELAVVNTDR